MKNSIDESVFGDLLLLPKMSTIDDEVFQIMIKSIHESEKNEIFWADKLTVDNNIQKNLDIYHSSRMLRCSLIGFNNEIKEAIGTKDNPVILENSSSMLEVVNKVVKQFNVIIDNNRDEDQLLTLKELTSHLEKIADNYIKSAREIDFLDTDPKIIEDVKKSIIKITSEI